MRISTNQLHTASLNAMLTQQAGLSKTQLQIASGKKILSPADDPIGSAKVLSLNENISMSAQHQKNISIARSRLSLEENIIGNLRNLLDRVREIALQGNNSSLSDADRTSLSVEIRLRLEEVLSLTNSQDANGEYIFSGYQGLTRPFSQAPDGSYNYSGDDGERYLQISRTRQVSVGHSGSDVFLKQRNGNGTFAVTDAASNRGSGVIDTGTATDASAYDGRVHTINFVHSTAVKDTLSFSDNVGVDDTLNYNLNINGTLVYNVDETGTPISSVSDLADQINLSTGTTGVVAHIGTDGEMYLYNSDGSASAITINEEMTGGSDPDDQMTGYFGSWLSASGPTSKDTVFDEQPSSYFIVNEPNGDIVTEGNYISGVQIAFEGLQTNIRGEPQVGDTFTISPSVNQDIFTTISNLADAFETGYGGASGMALLSNASSRFLVDIDGVTDNLSRVRADVGARLNVLDTQEAMNEDFTLLLRTSMSNIMDLDYADAITRLTQGTMALEAAQKSYVQIRSLSLFDYL